MIRAVTGGGARGVTVHFGTNKVDRHTDEFPCRVWRVVTTAKGDEYREIRRVALTIRPDRRVLVREQAVREGGKGWRSNAIDQRVEVRPDDWRPLGAT